MKVIVIHEENHGEIGIAANYHYAVKWLIKNQWLDDTTEVCLEQCWVSVLSLFGSDWKNLILDYWDNILIFNSVFSGCFYLEEVEVYGSEMD